MSLSDRFELLLWSSDALLEVLSIRSLSWASLNDTVASTYKALPASHLTLKQHWGTSSFHTSWSEVKLLSRVRLFATPRTVAHQAPPSMGFSRQEYWSGLPFPSPGDLPDPGIEPGSPAFQADALTSEPPGKPCCKQPFLFMFGKSSCILQKPKEMFQFGWWFAHDTCWFTHGKSSFSCWEQLLCVCVCIYI